MAITIDDPARLEGTQVRGGDGSKLGDVEAVYYDNDTDRPEWVSVRSGLFGSHVSIVPLQSADYDGKELRVPFDKEALKSAPHHDPGRELSPRDEEDLFRHYGVSDGDRGRTHDGRTRESRDTDDAMTRSEERLRVGTETHEAGRARLRKRVVTEHQEVRVPVSHEEVRVEREPITDSNRGAARSGPEISEDEHEVTIHGNARWSRRKPSRSSGSDWAPRRCATPSGWAATSATRRSTSRALNAPDATDGARPTARRAADRAPRTEWLHPPAAGGATRRRSGGS